MSLLRSLQAKLFHSTRVEPVLQHEASECGLACLCMIAQFYGHKSDLAELRAELGAQMRGMNLQALINQADKVGFSSRAVKVDIEELSALQLPAILHWDFTHFVVLHKIGRRYSIVDPSCGEISLSPQQLSESFTGIALELRPNHDFTPCKATQSLSLFDFIRNLQGLGNTLGLIFLLSFGVQFFALFGPFYMQVVIDQVVTQHADDLLLMLALGFALLLLLECLFVFIREHVVLRLSTSVGLVLSASSFQHLLSLPSQFFLSRHLGDILSRFNSVHQIRDFLVSGIVSGLIDGLMALITLAVIFIYSAKLALIVCVFCFIYALLRWLCVRPMRRMQNQILVSDAKQQSYFIQSVRAINTLKLGGKIQVTQADWLNKLNDLMNHQLTLSRWQINLNLANKVCFGFENIMLIFVGASLVLNQVFTVGMLVAFMSYKHRFISAFDQLVSQFIRYMMLSVPLKRLEDIVYSPSEVTNEEGFFQNQSIQQQLTSIEQHKALVAEQMSFQHESDSLPLFENIDLSVDQADIVAIIGPSGCGKTSLLHCLSGLYALTHGHIYVHGRALSPHTRANLHIATVLQSDALLSGSILQNIAGFGAEADLAKVAKCANLACIAQDIMAMPMQFNTLIGDMGASLSGGQQQRVLLARAIYQDPNILLLDEATSHLDIATEKTVMSNIRQLGICVVMIAHRAQTIACADYVYRLENKSLCAVDKAHFYSQYTTQ